MGVANWFRWLLWDYGSTSEVPEGFTDDMSVPLPADRTPEQVVDFVIAANEGDLDHAALVAALGTEFGLSAEDAELAIDRVGGGMFRAMTGNLANCPNRDKDPIAWASFQRAIGEKPKS